jgi:hypothetical protein
MFFITRKWILEKIIAAVKIERDAHEITFHGAYTYDYIRYGKTHRSCDAINDYEHKWKSLIGIIKSKDKTITKLKEELRQMKHGGEHDGCSTGRKGCL